MMIFEKYIKRDFPGDTLIKISLSKARGMGSIPGQVAKI